MKHKVLSHAASLYLLILAPSLLLVPEPGNAQPVNDAFANGQSLSGSTGSVTGNNVGATKETGEPNHAGDSGGHSVWYRWTAPANTPVTIDTIGSSFDTLLGVYTGSSVSTLTTIASNDDIDGPNQPSRVSFTPVAGTTYQIAVDGWNGDTGTITLNLVQTVQDLPDLMIWGPSISPRITTVTFSSSSCAVVEGLVQAAAGLKIGFCLLDSIRWDANAPSRAKYDCGNQGIQQGWGDVYDSTLDGQWIDITGVPDGSYTLEMEVNPEHRLPESNYNNNITRIQITIGNARPANDNFVDAQGLSGSSASVSGTSVGASKEAGEPNHAGNPGGHSVWYVWTAPSSRTVTVDTVGSSFDTLLAVYTGSSVSALTTVTSNDDLSSTTKQSG